MPFPTVAPVVLRVGFHGVQSSLPGRLCLVLQTKGLCRRRNPHEIDHTLCIQPLDFPDLCSDLFLLSGISQTAIDLRVGNDRQPVGFGSPTVEIGRHHEVATTPYRTEPLEAP